MLNKYDSVCRLMVEGPYKGLIEHKERQAKENRDAVLNSVRELVTASSVRIKDHLDLKSTQLNQQVKERAERMYEKGEVTEKEKLEYVNKQTTKSIDLRSIQRWLKILTREGLLNKTGNTYFLSEIAKSDIRYFPQFFGGSTLAQLLQHLYSIKTKEQRLSELINIFGLYTLYCFVEAAKPVENDFMNEVEKDKLLLSWIEGVFSPLQMSFYLFLAAIKHEQEKEYKELRKTLKKDHTPIIWKRSDNFSIWRYPKPLSELTSSEALTNRFNQTLENEYPAIYEQLSKVRTVLVSKPTIQSLSSERKKMGV